jgi:hypothetical protein
MCKPSFFKLALEDQFGCRRASKSGGYGKTIKFIDVFLAVEMSR